MDNIKVAHRFNKRGVKSWEGKAINFSCQKVKLYLNRVKSITGFDKKYGWVEFREEEGKTHLEF